MDVILIPGLWLPSTVWSDVAGELTRRGQHPVPMPVPGIDEPDTSATLADQLTAVLAAIDAAVRPLVVAHSAASTLAWLAADRRPTAIAGVVMIGGFPAADGDRYADLFPIADGVMPFPGWEPFEGDDTADLDDAARNRLESVAVPVPEAVATASVTLVDDRRFDVPIFAVCPEFSPDDLRAWITAGEIPELARATRVSYIDIDSGHWPMVTRPLELAAIIDEIAKEVEPVPDA